MFKKLFLLIFIFLLLPFSSLAQVNNRVYFFWAEGCPHCAKEKIFLSEMQDKYPDLIIDDYDITKDKKGIALVQSFEKQFDIEVTGVPFIVIGEKYYIGYYNDETTGANIEEAILQIYKPIYKPIVVENNDSNIVDIEDNNSEILEINLPTDISEGENQQIKSDDLPEVAGFDLSKMSLPLVTVILGFLDGFNPCAMWALIFLITLLLGMQDRKRMWVLGIVFIFTSAFVYFLFMVAWLNLILFLGFIFAIRLSIGLIALGGGAWNIKKFFTDKDGTCKVTGSKEKRQFFEKLKKITQQRSFIFALLGIILLAFAVNLVELICSAGLPAVYTQVLALNSLSTWQYYAYIILYILFFMLDDLFVFFVAMTTLQITGLSTKYSRWSNLIGGMLMLIIGLLLIFKHEILMF